MHLLEGGREYGGRPLYCLHATAYSGRSFTPLLNALLPHRPVVALDTPGYGGSDAPSAPLDLQGYVEAIDRALEAAGETQIDLFGYHTGALLAAELANLRPDRVARLILIGVPCFTGQEQADWRDRLAQPTQLTEALDQFRDKWDFFIAHRPPGVDLARGFENFVDELRAWPDGWWAHDAAFRFDVERCLAQVLQPVLVLNPNNHLAPASRRAAALLANATLVELPHLSNGIFDVAADEIAGAMNAFLDSAVDHCPAQAQPASREVASICP